MKPLRVCVDARFISGEYGGVEQFVIGLASGLSKLTDGSEEYLFLTYADSQDWIAKFLGGQCQILEDQKAPSEAVGSSIIRQYLPGFHKIWHSIDPRIFKRTIPQVNSNGLIESSDIDVMHFTGQSAFMTTIPSIYHPHDLQHIHLPENYSLRTRVLIDQMFRTFCSQAKMVSAVSEWVKNDLIQQYNLTQDIVKVVPYAPAVSEYSMPNSEDLSNIQQAYSLPKEFIFYPAHTWPHKNHIGLLEAISILRERLETKVSVVFSGKKTDFYKTIGKKVKELKLEDQAYFLGFVTPEELRGLYKLSRGVVIPTRFEAASIPLWEAFIMEVPVACSNVTSLPAQAGDSALIFDPNDPVEMAQQIHRIWINEELRSDLIQKGSVNVSRFSWERTARIFRAHYRRIAQRPLTADDLELLNAPNLF
jgi:glycosyltransferase involved in cell wall biosynthesis